MSVVIAPEGTRSLTPRLGRFKKGAFHIAMQAGAPVVPVVFRNTYEVMRRGSLLFRPGTVDVCVLPPIDVTAWRIDDLDRHVADVRRAVPAHAGRLAAQVRRTSRSVIAGLDPGDRPSDAVPVASGPSRATSL